MNSIEWLKMKNIIVNQYKNKYSTTNKEINLQDIFENIRSKNINQPKADRKAIIYCTTSTKGRRHEDIVSFTGLLFIDIDECKHPKTIKEIMTKIKYTVAVWYSSSGNVHALIKVPLCLNVDEFKRRYRAFIQLLEPLIKGLGKIDSITSNPTQLAFESYDAEIIVKNNPIVFEHILPVKKQSIQKGINLPTDECEKWCINWITRRVGLINTLGYPQLLKYAYSLGGYSAGGYISQSLAEETLLNAININEYFNSYESSGSLSTYQKGGIAAFRKGLEKPIEWK
tara:strand:- start:934 stop:1785 length:852 start_codon:yes stop_codon:yes gene_type:complete